MLILQVSAFGKKVFGGGEAAVSGVCYVRVLSGSVTGKMQLRKAVGLI